MTEMLPVRHDLPVQDDASRKAKYAEAFKLPQTRDEFEIQGTWSPRDGVSIRMWRHKASGYVLYEDHEETRKKGLPLMIARLYA